MKVKITSPTIKLMSLFKIAFQVFFQPGELENYLSQQPAHRKQIFWRHVALAPICVALAPICSVIYFFTGYIFPLNIFPLTFDRVFVVTGVLGVFSYILTIFIALAIGGFFKRENIVSFIFGTYCNLILVLLELLAVYIVESEIFGGSTVVFNFFVGLFPLFALMCIGAGIVTLYGKTTGVKFALLFSIVLSLLFTSILTTSLNVFQTLLVSSLFAFLPLCLGIYRIPVYVVEVFLQVLSLSMLHKSLPKAINMSPLFFDYISTLPLPFSRQLMRQIAAKNIRLYADKITYLLENTHHQKLASTLFEEFHEQHQEFLFDDLYKRLQSEKRDMLDSLTKELQENRPIGKLIHSYNHLLSTRSRKPHLKNHADILQGFAVDQYLFAQELYLTYHVFHIFSGFQNLQEITQADQLLADILKISYGDLLNVPLIETLSVIGELSNDLKNYDVVENFRDKQYFLSEARIKLYNISRKAEEELHDPERTILLEIVEQWESI
ncbi:MAG: hypothetical protein GY797_33070, partial [Deltaproteobacteria bacterium]|nr:hypothetical protein [Deltaproteobacteria bacterium]